MSPPPSVEAGPETLVSGCGGVAVATAGSLDAISDFAAQSELKGVLSGLFEKVVVEQPTDVIDFLITELSEGSKK